MLCDVSLKEIDGESYLKSIDKYKEEYFLKKSVQFFVICKTNELFTRMMINVALFSSDYDFSDKIKLLDQYQEEAQHYTKLPRQVLMYTALKSIKTQLLTALHSLKFLSKFKHKAEKHRVNPKNRASTHCL